MVYDVALPVFSPSIDKIMFQMASSLSLIELEVCRLMGLFILRRQQKSGETIYKGLNGKRNGGSTTVQANQRSGLTSGAASIQTLL